MKPLPAQLVITCAGLCLDGGTLSLNAKDEQGRRHCVELAQRLFPDVNRTQISGRLYFDDELIELRSEREAQLLSLLRDAAFDPRPIDPSVRERTDFDAWKRSVEKEDRMMCEAVISFVESPAYLSHAERVQRILQTEPPAA